MTKTCGECKHFELDEIAANCNKHCLICNDDAPACEDFEPKIITNGDKIRQMSNEELVEFMKDVAAGVCEHCVRPENYDCSDLCHIGILDWLNAPAESEGEDE